MSPLMIVLIVLIVLAVGGGAFGHNKYGWAGYSPVGILLVVLLLVLIFGNR